ncbi:DNA-(apurinic or apyrimidinic site) lyase /endonuclease III [Dethiosulfatibacter aminovorans DSM 17477]|uniref:Endonuclease III n=1 Tax=Dethiosulfatibacter aminovorans DSM 17477 TaxID=1121476 RepID=A0A1M6FC94_9FIRM|nr:endonuclease III [Dethiosulfatibacter aminovorans]SHI95297.1 DNA-(apurinic or apyrimidinic site) lyase /endonuclease III [Dethiosulfatibacter aminovorans DSM 17477]
MDNVEEILDKLEKQHPDARCELYHNTPFQLLVATVLSAQSTDKSVNKVTVGLFEEYPDLDSFITLEIGDIEDKIRKIGLYKNKSRSIYNICRVLKSDFDGMVPCGEKELMSLPGVGRKTASVVRAVAFGIPAFAVDTHVFRVTRRIGLTEAKTPDKVSDDLMKLIPEDRWILSHHLFIFHGRRICKAKNPLCAECMVFEECMKIGL